MNNQEVGYVFAEKFNNDDISYGDGYNVLRGKGYSASILDLVFDEQFYGDPQYGGAEYGGISSGYYTRWMFTSSLTQSFYDANPGISPDESLYVLYQNYVPTGSASAAIVQYVTYIPLSTQNYTFAPADPNFTFSITGEYYSLGMTNPNELYVSTASGEITTTSIPTTKPTSSTWPGSASLHVAGYESGSFSLTAKSTDPQLAIGILRRYISTGSVFVLRNLKITYPVDSTIFEPFAQTQDLHLQTSAGMINARYEGSKMTSPDFNIDSPDTIDGGPVVTVTPVNPKSPTIGSSVPKNKVLKPEIQKPGFVSGKGNFKIK